MNVTLINAIHEVLAPSSLLAVLVGTAVGIFFGALPGFSATMGVAVLIPITFKMSPTAGLIMLGGVYCGAIYGGSISAVLLHTPGTDAAAMTALDGYELTKQGRGGEALAESAIASFWGGIFSTFCLLFFAPPLSKIALQFGPPENFMLAVFGLSIIAMVCADSFAKGILGALFGLLIGTIGIDPMYGNHRYTFGTVGLMSGVALVPALIGLYSISQLMVMAYNKNDSIIEVDIDKIRKSTHFNIKDMFRFPVVYLRSAILGTVIGILPGAGTNIAAFLGYNEGKRASKHPELFGKGSREAIAACECANNAVTGGSLIPTLTLGIPGNAVSAVLMGGLMIQGLIPGYALFSEKADITYPFILSLFFANLIFLVIGLSAAPYFAKISGIPINILVGVIGVLCVMGSYALNRSAMDVVVMLLFGILGFILNKYGFQPSPIVLGMILGPIGDKALNQTYTLCKNENLFLFILKRPICLVLLLATAVTFMMPVVQKLKKMNIKSSQKQEGES